MSEWDVIAFGDLDDDTSLFKRVTAATSDEALTVFKGLFAVAFPVKHSVSEPASCVAHAPDTIIKSSGC